MTHYQKPAELYDGLRLHQNENTGGCSPRVLEALAALRADQIGYYPPYAATVETCARHFGVDADRLMLVNGLDEGIMAIAVTLLRPTRRRARASKRSSRSRRSRSSRTTRAWSAAAPCASRRSATFSFRWTRCWRRSRRRRGSCF